MLFVEQKVDGFEGQAFGFRVEEVDGRDEGGIDDAEYLEGGRVRVSGGEWNEEGRKRMTKERDNLGAGRQERTKEYSRCKTCTLYSAILAVSSPPRRN